MKAWHGILFAVALLLAAYYVFLFTYARRLDEERRANLLWKVELRGGSDLCADPLSDGSVVASANGLVYWFNENGAERATYNAFAPEGERTKPPEPEQSFNRPFQYFGYPENFAWAAGAGDLCFLSTQQAQTDPVELVAVDADGQERWRAELPAKGGISWIAYSDDFVYALQQDGSLAQFTLAGEQQWMVQAVGYPSGLSIGADGWAYVVEEGPNGFEAVTLDETGKERWRNKNMGYLSGRPAVDTDGTAYYLDYSGLLTAIGRDGKAKWTYTPPLRRSPSSFLANLFGWGSFNSYPMGADYSFPTITGDGVSFLHDGRVIKVRRDGSLGWIHTPRTYPSSHAAGPDGSVYLACPGEGIVALSPEGRVNWRNRSVRTITSMPSVGADGRMYIEADDRLYCFEP